MALLWEPIPYAANSGEIADVPGRGRYMVKRSRRAGSRLFDVRHNGELIASGVGRDVGKEFAERHAAAADRP